MKRDEANTSPYKTETVRSMVSTRFRKLELLPTSDRALMHSGISVIAQYSHERRVNLPNDNGHSFTETQRRSDKIRGKPQRFHPSGLSPRLVLSSSSLSTQTDQECFGIPRFPFRLSLQLHGSSPPPPPGHSLVHCIPLCSNYEKECSFGTRQGTYNGQQPLQTIIDPRILV